MKLDRTLGIFAVALVLFFAGANFGSAQTAPCGTTTWNLTAGQTNDVGSVTVSNDNVNIYVTFTLDYPGATFGTLHAWVGSDLSLVPANPQGTPVPGHFPYQYNAAGLTEYTFVIPFASISIPDVSAVCNQKLYVVTHAEVDMDGDGSGDTETAFGGDKPGSGPRWWFYGEYSICCDFPPDVCSSETAFAKGGWVFTTEKKSNPENLPTLRLSRNRWGWAINLTATGTTSYYIWAGAGLNETANGKLVGTLTVEWDGAQAVVTYNLTPGYLLEEVHLYAQDARPTTAAPGQYGYLDYFDPGRTTYSFTVPLQDSNGTDGVWLIAHAVVSIVCK